MSTESTVRTETVPQTWNDEIDTPFFRIVARLFSAEFTYGAGVLLSGFDVDPVAGTDLEDAPEIAVAVVSADRSSALVPVAARRHR